MTIAPPNEDEYGAFSPLWMLKALLNYVPHANLLAANGALIQYWNSLRDDADLPTMIDIMAQVAATGSFIETVAEDEPRIRATIFTSEDGWIADEDSAPPITEDEIADFVDEMGEYPDAVDPFDGKIVC